MLHADNFGLLAMGSAAGRARPTRLAFKSVGESRAIAAPTEIINALLDALRPLGVEDIEMPATPFRVWTAIQEAESRKPAA